MTRERRYLRTAMSFALKLLVAVQALAIVLLQTLIHKRKLRDYSEWEASVQHGLQLKYCQAYIGDDYPRTWSIPASIQAQVATPFENSVQFAFDVDTADEIWESQFPRQGLIQLGQYNQTFSISLFHQLRCISLVREDIIQRRASNYTTRINPLTGHCLNYLRQMAMCRSDIDLESVLFKPHAEPHPDVYRCTDWKTVYSAVLDNHRLYPVQVGNEDN